MSGLREQSFEYTGKNILVVGAGKSGIAALSLLHRMGARGILYDGNEKLTKEALLEKHPGEMKDVELYIKEVPEEVLREVYAAVLSPGVPVDTGFAKELSDRGIPLSGEIELAYLAEQGELLAITGTNGKTTTTSLVGEIMKAYKETVFVVGNIGEPYTASVWETTPESESVAEISSFQLETVNSFHPHVSAILNITPDHLNRHHTMECYASMKERIAENQTKEDFCVLNYEDSYTRDFGEHRCGAKVLWFSSQRNLEEGYYLDGDTVFEAVHGQSRPLLNIHEDMNLVGICNVENVMAAIAMTKAAGVPEDVILSAVKQFKAVEHRIEFIRTVKGVDYYNDSKATNPDAAIQGIRAMSKPTILIGGGYDKGNEYDLWLEEAKGKTKLLVLIGQTADKIEECAKKHGITDILRAESFEECLDLCRDHAKPGDAVLLSPACASWGMFDNYEQRGHMFRDYVCRLEQ